MGAFVTSLDTFKSRRTLTAAGKTYGYFSLAAAEKNGLKGISRLPYSLKVLLENLLRHEDGKTVTAAEERQLWHDFHDKFLSYGGPPIPRLRAEMLGEEGAAL